MPGSMKVMFSRLQNLQSKLLGSSVAISCQILRSHIYEDCAEIIETFPWTSKELNEKYMKLHHILTPNRETK